jgi:hypothetical protein
VFGLEEKGMRETKERKRWWKKERSFFSVVWNNARK